MTDEFLALTQWSSSADAQSRAAIFFEAVMGVPERMREREGR